MRKKTLNYLFDNILWYMLYTLPLLMLIVISARSGTFTDISTAFSSLGLDIFIDNIFLTSLSDVFGASGVMPLFDSPDILIYLTYFISVYVLHIIVDILLWLPRLCHRWMNEFSCGGSD